MALSYAPHIITQLIAADDGAILASGRTRNNVTYEGRRVLIGIFQDREDSTNIFRAIDTEGAYRLFACINHFETSKRVDPSAQDHYDFVDGDPSRPRGVPDSWRVCPNQ